MHNCIESTVPLLRRGFKMGFKSAAEYRNEISICPDKPAGEHVQGAVRRLFLCAAPSKTQVCTKLPQGALGRITIQQKNTMDITY